MRFLLGIFVTLSACGQALALGGGAISGSSGGSLADGSVTAAKIADGAVITAKLGSAAITAPAFGGPIFATASGLVGVGTNDPASFNTKLAVRGFVTASGYNNSFHSSDATLSSFDLRHKASTVDLSAQGSALTISAGSAERAHFSSTGDIALRGAVTVGDANTTSTMTVTGAFHAVGNIGIGATSPTYDLLISNAGATEGRIRLTQSAVGSWDWLFPASQNMMLFSGDGGTTMDLAISANGFKGDVPDAQTITAGATVTADACGTIKRITAASAVATDTTNTFTAPGNGQAGNNGCVMRVCNSDGTNTITLDDNALFQAMANADVLLTALDCIEVTSDGALWWQTGDIISGN